jgi:hypothetical protein
MKTRFLILTLLTALAFVQVMIAYGCDNAVEEEPWYVGGTLQSATVEEWHKATYENRLATCADFIKAATRPDVEIDYDAIKPLAIELEMCITVLTEDLDLARRHPVLQYSAMCLIELEYVGPGREEN